MAKCRSLSGKRERERERERDRERQRETERDRERENESEGNVYMTILFRAVHPQWEQGLSVKKFDSLTARHK